VVEAREKVDAKFKKVDAKFKKVDAKYNEDRCASIFDK
jgi:hypothetical protein